MKIPLAVARVAAGVLITLVVVSVEGAEPNDRAASRLAREVRHELVTLPYYGVFDNLGYQINGNNVVLTGQVRSLGLKNAAEKAVKSIEGVDKVENKIDMLPPNTADDQIRLAIANNIYAQPSLQRYSLQAVPSIHIIVNNGAVTLEGAVLNDMDKQIAGAQANTIPGTFRVTNNLRVDQSTPEK